MSLSLCLAVILYLLMIKNFESSLCFGCSKALRVLPGHTTSSRHVRLKLSINILSQVLKHGMGALGHTTSSGHVILSPVLGISNS